MLTRILFLVLIHNTVTKEDNNEKYIQSLKGDWHVSSLSDPNFNEENCQSFERGKKFKKQKDAGLIDFVSSDPIPSNVSDLIQYKCEIDRQKSATKVPQINNLKKVNLTVETASTAKMDKGTKDLRRNDYQFSSVEYYDEFPDFDESQCPGDVELVILELDELRSYDLECEMIIEWRSLD